MSIAVTLKDFLEEMDAVYDVVHHPRHYTSIGIANRAHVAPERLAKGVLLRCETGMLTLAVVPADRMVDLDSLETKLDHHVALASEAEVIKIFDDCDPGAVPPVGNAYGVRVLLDDSLARQPEVFFETGDHEGLVHVNGSEFRRLMDGAKRGSFCRPYNGVDAA